MKRLLSILTALLFTVTVSGQVTEAILIDSSSFKAVNKDALTGVNIDAISVDSSRRPCARIKMKVNRMTREEINGLKMKIITNNECTKCKTAEYENGLIIELTAKPSTRFYLLHDKFGASNEVELNLEANKEYYIETFLNQQYSVTIASNVVDADVYIDNVFKGKTNSNYILTVQDMLAGEHELRVDYAGSQYSQKIVISSSAVYFKQDVNIAAAQMQYLTIITNPKNALVEVNGKIVENGEAGANEFLKPGAFYYTVSANNYHTYSGTGVMKGEKITLNIDLKPAFGYLNITATDEISGAQVYIDNSQRGTLPLDKPIVLKSGEHSIRIIKSMYKALDTKVVISDGNTSTLNAKLEPNFATVTITSPDNSEIWVDNTKRGVGSWSGKVEIGDHRIESRKNSYQTATHNLSIKSSANVSYNFEALKPIYGSVNITSNPMGATITIDGIEVGKTPLMKPDVLVGKRLISISKDGYRRATAVVDVAEGKMSEYSPTLTVATEQTRPTEQSTSAVESRQNTTQRQPRQSTTQQTTKSSSASKVRNTKTTTLNSSMIQVGTGVEYGLNAQSMLTTIPVELRLGLYNHLFNAFVSAEYNMRNSAFTESDNSSPFLPTIKATQWSFGAKLRLNLLRNMGKSGTTYFAEAGAKYNINTSATFTTGTIDYSTSSYNDGIESSTCYKGDLFNKGSLTGRLAIGCGAKMMEVAIFTSFDLTPTFKLDNLSYYVVDHQYNSPAVTLMDIPEVVQMFKSKAYVGITCKIFFGANSLKR